MIPRRQAEAAAAAASAAEAGLGGGRSGGRRGPGRRGGARSRLGEAEGAARALDGEMAGLERLLARPAGAVAPVLDAITVAPGFELALGAALADDLTLPLADAPDASGWHALAPLDAPPRFPPGRCRSAGR